MQIGEFCNLPIYAVFIGANLGIASVAFLQKIFNIFAIFWVMLALNLLSISAGICIFSSHLFLNSNIGGYFAVFFLLASYLLILVLSWFVPGRLKEKEETKEIVGSISPEIGVMMGNE